MPDVDQPQRDNINQLREADDLPAAVPLVGTDEEGLDDIIALHLDGPYEDVQMNGNRPLQDAEAQGERQRQIALRKLQDSAQRDRLARTTTFLDQLEKVRQLRRLIAKRSEQVAILTKDWLLSRSEALQLLRLSDLSKQDVEFCLRHCVSPEMIVALYKVKTDVRDEAMLLISAGRVLHKTDLAQMRRRRLAARPEIQRAEDERFVRSQAARKSADHLAALKVRIARMVRLLVLAYDKSWRPNNDRRRAFLQTAAMLSADIMLGEYNKLFPALPLAFDWYHADPRDRNIRLAKVRLVLERIARGDFQLLDLAESDGGDIELTLVQAIAWMVDIDVSHLEYRRDDNPEVDPEKEAWSAYLRSEEAQELPVLTSLEICSGAGGAAIGLHAAGFSSVGLIERNRHAVQTLIANTQLGPVIYKDVREINYSKYVGKVDLFAGGVPCQPHSVLGKQAGQADERDLFLHSVEIIRQIRPRAVMLENVLGFGQRQAAIYRAKIFSMLEDAGYEAQLFAISACDFGLAQARPRLVLVAMRDGLLSRFKMPPVMSSVPMSLGNALRELMAENGWAGAAAWANNATGVSPTIVGGSENSGNQGFSSNFQLDAWRNLGVDATKIALEAPSADQPFDHIPQLTLPMGAKLQGFPAAWKFEGTPREKRRQIGNAFPPILACAVGLAIREALTGKQVDYQRALSQSYIEAIGRHSNSAEQAVEVAAELDLPLGDAYWHAPLKWLNEILARQEQERANQVA